MKMACVTAYLNAEINWHSGDRVVFGIGSFLFPPSLPPSPPPPTSHAIPLRISVPLCLCVCLCVYVCGVCVCVCVCLCVCVCDVCVCVCACVCVCVHVCVCVLCSVLAVTRCTFELGHGRRCYNEVHMCFHKREGDVMRCTGLSEQRSRHWREELSLYTEGEKVCPLNGKVSTFYCPASAVVKGTNSHSIYYLLRMHFQPWANSR